MFFLKGIFRFWVLVFSLCGLELNNRIVDMHLTPSKDRGKSPSKGWFLRQHRSPKLPEVSGNIQTPNWPHPTDTSQKTSNKLTRWWFQLFFIFTPGEDDFQFDEHIFQLGWLGSTTFSKTKVNSICCLFRSMYCSAWPFSLDLFWLSTRFVTAQRVRSRWHRYNWKCTTMCCAPVRPCFCN